MRLTLAEFNNKELQEQLAAFLEQASTEAIHSLQAQAQKARVSVSEARDTSDPALITQMLMVLLEGIGDHATVPTLTKRVRDDVNLNIRLGKRIRDEADLDGLNIRESESLPWRRLPFWLVLRVAAQRQLNLSLGENGRACYKLLMCIFFSDLLQDTTKALTPLHFPQHATKGFQFPDEIKTLDVDLLTTLRTKLCRRMMKVEREKDILSTHKDSFQSLFSSALPLIRSSITAANSCVENLWEDFKKKAMRHIPRLPRQAPEKAFQLSLPNSGRYLEKLLKDHKSAVCSSNSVSLDLPIPFGKDVREAHDFTSQVYELTEMEQDIERDNQSSRCTVRNAERQCRMLADQIHNVFQRVGKIYDDDPALQSIKVLTIFELWMRMDESALMRFPLLACYRPIFTPELLDALQLPALSDMKRLLVIQKYLDNRHTTAQYENIFSTLNGNSFSVKYVEQSTQMKDLMRLIEDASEKARKDKIAEWVRTSAEYKYHIQQFNTMTCRCRYENRQWTVRGCTKCWHNRTQRKLKVQLHEDFLPTEEMKKKRIVFELAIPEYLSAYRNATWKILRDLTHPSRLSSQPPVTYLHKCPHLMGFMRAESNCISIASDKKFFQETHYSFSKEGGLLPLSKILLPFGGDFELYDHEAKIWVKDLAKAPTLHHICGIYVPSGLSTTILLPQQHPVTNLDGPPSYEIQANIPKCPPTLSVAEFSAYQKLLAGKSRRWLNILVELGSSNLNFSSEDTTTVLSQLAVQAGPCSGKDPDVLRQIHSVVAEREFVQKLRDQIKSRMESIYNNWRETNCMELLINLSLRILSLAQDDETRSEFEQLLLLARNSTFQWIDPSQEESRRAQDTKDADRIATYGLKAALLCRRTFEMYIASEVDLSPADLLAWVRASVALQESRMMSISGLPPLVRGMMIRDARMMFRIDSLIRAAVGVYPEAIAKAIGIDIQGTTIPSWTFLDSPHSQWVSYVMPKDPQRFQNMQVFHLNILQGHLLINGKQRGSLPIAIRNSEPVKYLFGDQNLFVYPSAMSGMEYTLVYPFRGQTVHFGIRNSNVIIRTAIKNEHFEFIPDAVFRHSNLTVFDLPASLLDNCAHWLNLNTGILEVRRQPSFWESRPRNWKVDVINRSASRGTYVRLVDPQSPIFQRVAKVFEHFEVPQKLTVFQSRRETDTLSVELRHLDLEFRVNKIGLLYSRQLKASIDFNQDAGTWYGLASKIILRDIADKDKRSIIIPNGRLTWRRPEGDIHASSYLGAGDGYFRFDIDDILGRLSAPPDPVLLYRKALCHAVTSFCLPDPLTGITGTEEALRILQSGAAQPWSPSSSPDLRELASLLPKREYYPPAYKRLQTVTWDFSLTTTIQNDRLETVIRNIEERANRIAKFSHEPKAQTNSIGEQTQLRLRAQARRSLYERATKDTAILTSSDKIYVPRDRQLSSRANQVYQVAKMIHSHNPLINITRNLRGMFDNWDYIGGFHTDNFSPNSEPLATQIETPIHSCWGSLIKLCSDNKHRVSTIFRLCLLSFYSEANMDVILSLAAFCCIKELKELERPEYGGFTHFKDRGLPSVELLRRLISEAYLPYPKKAGKSNRRWGEQRNHDENCDEEGRLLAEKILEQWPVLPTTLSFDDAWVPSHIDVPLALSSIRPEWDRRRQNDELATYLGRVDVILRRYRHRGLMEKPQKWPMGIPNVSRFSYQDIIPSISRDLVVKSGPKLNRIKSYSSAKSTEVKRPQSDMVWEAQRDVPPEFTELGQILESFSKSPDALRKNYSSDLLRSLAALKSNGRKANASSLRSIPESREITRTIEQIQAALTHYQESIRDALWHDDNRFTWLALGDILPCRTVIEMLELLQSRATHQFGTGMKEALIYYGCAITEIQRLRRLRHAILLNDRRAMIEELYNVGHENWDPAIEDPDWLLLEIDSNILIRTDQVDVARAIINPASGENSVLQMNMGRGKKSLTPSYGTNADCHIVGKSSCIMPMAAAVLANGDNVSRLIVPKSLIMQTVQMMHSRLGGLVGRDVCHIPFSRQTPTTDDMLASYSLLHRNIQESRGLILTSHEHVLSFRLSGLQRLVDNKSKEAKTMIDFQDWLDVHCRDILDESDFTLSPKTQLNYPSGSDMVVDGHPFRWQVAEGLLSMVSEYIPQLQAAFPGSLEILTGSDRFPTVQFLRSDVEDELHRLIVDDVSNGKAPFLLTEKGLDADTKMIIKGVLSDQDFNETLFEKAVGSFSHPESARTKLLTVRGLVTRKILVLCLAKRWNVQYGLHPHRPPVAVPFAAKGVPSELSEYGHPDVAIVLTCLSFYSAGLSYEQFRQGLQRMLASEDAPSEYEKWASASTVPASLQHWNLINLDDETQIQSLWSCLHRTQVVTNYYMNNFVFPLHARQFTTKLQASAWDIPLGSKAAITSSARTTGFSGTNDNRYLLPMTIQQEDLPGLLQTNAEVLSYLLQLRNKNYAVLTDNNHQRLSENGMLKELCENGIKILIDAGAYILEMGNREVARMWLSIDAPAQAAVYFRSDNRAWVTFSDPAKIDMPLFATRLADNLEDCLVYFDEAHTRGVDLKLPENAHAALTLALKQTKDNTMQGKYPPITSPSVGSYMSHPKILSALQDENTEY